MRTTPPVAVTSQSSLPDVLQFMQALWALAHGLERLSKQMSKTIGVTAPQRLALRVIGLFPGIAAGELATVLRIHPSTLTGILQRLVERRLVVRAGDQGDRRLARLRLTSRGRGINRNGRGTVEAAVATALAECSRADRAVAGRVLARVARHLDPDRARGAGVDGSAGRATARRRTKAPRQ